MDFFSWWVYILPIFAALFLFGRIKERYGKIDLFSWWTYGESTAWAIAGFGILYLIPYLFYEKILYWREVPLRNAPDGVTIADWWYEKTVPWESPVGFLLIVFLIVYGAMMKKDPKTQVHHKLAPYGLWLVIILLLFHFFGNATGSAGKVASWWKGNNPPVTTALTPSGTAMMGRAETQDFVTTFWYQNLPIGDAREMLNITQCESGFNQWDDNGNVVVNTNDDGSTDTCVMQINSRWQAEADKLGHNLTTLNGCLNMALHIRTKESARGAKEWTGCYEQVMRGKDQGPDSDPDPDPVPAFPDWSEVFQTKANCIWENTETMLVKDDKGKVHTKEPGVTLNVITWTFQVSTPEGKTPGTMRYICR